MSRAKETTLRDARVLSYIREHGPVPRAQVRDALSLHRNSYARCERRLLDLAVVRREGRMVMPAEDHDCTTNAPVHPEMHRLPVRDDLLAEIHVMLSWLVRQQGVTVTELMRQSTAPLRGAVSVQSPRNAPATPPPIPKRTTNAPSHGAETVHSQQNAPSDGAKLVQSATERTRTAALEARATREASGEMHHDCTTNAPVSGAKLVQSTRNAPVSGANVVQKERNAPVAPPPIPKCTANAPVSGATVVHLRPSRARADAATTLPASQPFLPAGRQSKEDARTQNTDSRADRDARTPAEVRAFKRQWAEKWRQRTGSLRPPRLYKMTLNMLEGLTEQEMGERIERFFRSERVIRQKQETGEWPLGWLVHGWDDDYAQPSPEELGLAEQGTAGAEPEPETPAAAPVRRELGPDLLRDSMPELAESLEAYTKPAYYEAHCRPCRAQVEDGRLVLRSEQPLAVHCLERDFHRVIGAIATEMLGLSGVVYDYTQEQLFASVQR